MASTSGAGADVPGASALIIGELQDEVQCPICQERLTRPRVLSCLHSFCERCLRRRPAYLDSDDEDEYGELPFIKCALCREITELPEGGVSGLKLDFRSNKVLEVLDALDARKRKFAESEYKCDVCSGSGESGNVPAADYCQDCGQLFCEQCSKVHRRLTDTKDHHVVAVSGLMTGKAKLRKTEHETDTYKTCPDHSGERYKYFCKTCIKPVCSLCNSFGACKSHQSAVCALGDSIPELSGVVKMLTDRLMHRQRRVEKVLDSTSSVIAKTEDVKKTSIEKQQKRHCELIRLLNAKFQRAVSEREASFGSKIQGLQGIAEKVHTMKVVSDRAIALSADVMKESMVDGRDLATVFGCLQSVLGSVLPGPLESLERDVSTIEKNVSSMPDIKMKGVRLEWSLDEKLTVEPIFLDRQVSVPQNYSCLDPRAGLAGPSTAPALVRRHSIPTQAYIGPPAMQSSNIQVPVMQVPIRAPPSVIGQAICSNRLVGMRPIVLAPLSSSSPAEAALISSASSPAGARGITF